MIVCLLVYLFVMRNVYIFKGDNYQNYFASNLKEIYFARKEFASDRSKLFSFGIYLFQKLFSVQKSKPEVTEIVRFQHWRKSIQSLQKHAYSNILKILPPKKNENFQIKKF